ncbi:MAG TPA: hypothetical protein VMU65_11330 [Candidatus Saccharimonadales bacterium]|nr:hypothetical protein [Candidatus Saccharimonadales bacterium]
MEIVELRPLLHLIKPVLGQVYVWQDGSQLTMVDTGIPGSQQELTTVEDAKLCWVDLPEHGLLAAAP